MCCNHKGKTSHRQQCWEEGQDGRGDKAEREKAGSSGPGSDRAELASVENGPFCLPYSSCGNTRHFPKEDLQMVIGTRRDGQH